MSCVPEVQSCRTSDALISYRDVGSGPALLLLHGAAPGETGWDSFAASIEFLQHRFRVVVPDQPGFGRSHLLHDSGLPYNALSAKAMAELLGHLDIAQAHVSGNSLGGGVALRMALEHPAVVDRIALIAPYVGGFCPRLLAPPPEGGALLRDYYPHPTPEKMRNLLTGLMADVNTISNLDGVVTSRYESTLAPGIEEAHQRLARGGWVEDPERRTPAEWISTIGNVTLLMWGRDDRFCPTEDAFHYLSALRRSELVVLPHTGHWLHHERADEFVAYLTTFLTR
ncbi:alpha/beta fold hydrolase [Rhodococcoides fascians]|uniref:alpha/beta fold hydrolase n=1 Tax=Rhodococcoides fascians TaxID=1828 RepID=UPI0012D2C0CC|nr:alpha/beta fold hydrolase [Rhodococcus fascians]